MVVHDAGTLLAGRLALLLWSGVSVAAVAAMVVGKRLDEWKEKSWSTVTVAAVR